MVREMSSSWQVAPRFLEDLWTPAQDTL